MEQTIADEVQYYFFDLVLWYDIIVAHVAYLLRGLYDAYMARVKVKERHHEYRLDPESFKSKPRPFDLKYYLKDNTLKWTFCYVAMWALFVVVPEIMIMANWEENWNAVVAAGVGFGSLEIVQLLIRRGKAKLNSMDANP